MVASKKELRGFTVDHLWLLVHAREDGWETALDIFMEKNESLVRSACYHLWDYGLEVEDKRQYVRMALFDVAMEGPFANKYALMSRVKLRALKYLKVAVRTEVHLIHYSSYALEVYSKDTRLTPMEEAGSMGQRVSAVNRNKGSMRYLNEKGIERILRLKQRRMRDPEKGILLMNRLPSEAKSADICLAKKQERIHLEEAFSQLTPRLQKVIVSYFVHERSTPEIGEELGVSGTMVRNYLRTALRELRKKLARRGIEWECLSLQ